MCQRYRMQAENDGQSHSCVESFKRNLSTAWIGTCGILPRLRESDCLTQLALDISSCSPTRANSSVSSSSIMTISGRDFTYTIKPSKPTFKPFVCNRRFQAETARSSPALQSSGLNMSPCLTPGRIAKHLLPCTELV